MALCRSMICRSVINPSHAVLSMEMLMKTFSLFATLWILSGICTFAGNAEVDSLLQELDKTEKDKNSVHLLLLLSENYRTINIDSSLLFAEMAKDLSEKFSFRTGLANSYKYIGIVYYYQSDYVKTLENWEKSFEIYEELAESPDESMARTGKEGMTNTYNNIGILHYYEGSYDTAVEYFGKSLEMAEELGLKKAMSNSYLNTGAVHENQGNYQKSIEYYCKALEILEELGDLNGMSECYNNIGNVYFNQGSYDKAIQYHHRSLKNYEKLGNKKGISLSYTNIGNVHSSQGNHQKAIEYYLKSIEIEETFGDHRGISFNYNNIGEVYRKLGNQKKSLEYYLKSLKIREELNDQRGMSECYTNIGQFYQEQGNFEKSVEYYLKSLSIQEEIGDKEGKALSYAKLASLNSVLADTAVITKGQRIRYLDQAVNYGGKALRLAGEIKATPIENEAASVLMEVYQKLGNYKKAMDYAEIFIATKDTMFNEEKTKALAEMEIRYEAEKKQQEIEKQKILISKGEEELRRKNTQRNAFIGGFTLMMVLAVIIYRNYRQKKKANRIINEKNEHLEQANAEITEQKEEIESQRDEIEAQRDTVTRQKEQIETIHRSLTDSIDYAFRIQQAVLPGQDTLDDILGEHFILFKPHSVVSGDYYWSTRMNNWIIFCVADCTGHGVPGAFMSMLGVSFLNEIVRKKEVIRANRVLDQLRASVVESLKQKGMEGEQKDGMDISICALNTETNELQFAGANNPLYLVRNNNARVPEYKRKLEYNGSLLYEIEGDKMPIAIHERMDRFTNHRIETEKGDAVYLFSDGYADQFGGDKNKKFKYKPFKRLLLEASDKPMNEQKEIIDKTFEDWKGDNEQVDDVCVMGVKICIKDRV